VKLPKKLSILGHKYKVKTWKNTAKEGAGQVYGRCMVEALTIFIATEYPESQVEATLLHEIIEALNYHLELRLEHNQIQGLEAGLYSVLKDAGLYGRKGCK